jgi:outer membrane protein assembly factor BamB
MGGEDEADDDGAVLRRRFLAATGTGVATALAGCSGGDPEDTASRDPTSARPTTAVESESTFATTTEDATATDTDEPTETEEPSDPDVGTGDRWPTFQYDDANLGYAPDNSGPDGDLAVQWAVPFENASLAGTSNGQPVLANDVVYAAYPAQLESEERYNLLCFRAHDAQNGEELWQTVVDPFPDEPNYPVGLTAGLTYAAGYVYGITEASNLFALNAETGAVEWRRSWDLVDRYTNVSPMVRDGVVYVALGFPTTGNTDGGVRALDARTGETIWKYVDAGGYMADGDADDTVDDNDNGYFQGMAMGEESLYLAGGTSGIYALDPSTGAERWELHDVSSENVTFADGRVYCYTSDVVAAVTPAGTVDWQTSVGTIANNNFVQAGWAFANDLLYVVTYTGEVVAIDAASGTEAWRASPDDRRLGAVRGSPILVDDGDVVYVGTSVGVTYALDAKTGSERWHSEYTNAQGGYFSVANGALYVQSTGYMDANRERYEGGLVVLA